ncbi:MAG: alpha/beta hydrolase, partial [candidate division Zixibacteria bacterium]|nr:alpha/beta hydrolase [candidate division Zixibacteria bacterium]
GIILESTFNRMVDVGRKAFPYLPISFLLRERYDSEEIIRSLDKPVLVIHSPDDEVIPFELGRRLYGAAIGEKSFVEIKGSHNSGLEISEEALRIAYRDFFDKFSK